MSKIRKQIRFKMIESSEVPGRARQVLIQHLEGGFWNAYLMKQKTGYALYIGGGSASEPLMRIVHSFQTRMEALLYAQYLFNLE